MDVVEKFNNPEGIAKISDPTKRFLKIRVECFDKETKELMAGGSIGENEDVNHLVLAFMAHDQETSTSQMGRETLAPFAIAYTLLKYLNYQTLDQSWNRIHAQMMMQEFASAQQQAQSGVQVAGPGDLPADPPPPGGPRLVT